MKSRQVVVREFDWSDVMPSELGRVFATRRRCEEYCQREGFIVIARVKGNSGVFYAPLLRGAK